MEFRLPSQTIIGSIFLICKPYQNCMLIFFFIFMCVRYLKKILKSWTILVLTNRFICLPITKHNCGRIINSYRIFSDNSKPWQLLMRYKLVVTYWRNQMLLYGKPQWMFSTNALNSQNLCNNFSMQTNKTNLFYCILWMIRP